MSLLANSCLTQKSPIFPPFAPNPATSCRTTTLRYCRWHSCLFSPTRIEEPYIPTKEQYIFAKEPYISATALCCCKRALDFSIIRRLLLTQVSYFTHTYTKEPYISAKEPYKSAQEPYSSTKELYILTEPNIPTQECAIFLQ